MRQCEKTLNAIAETYGFEMLDSVTASMKGTNRQAIIRILRGLGFELKTGTGDHGSLWGNKKGELIIVACNWFGTSGRSI